MGIFKNANGEMMKFDDDALAKILGYTEKVIIPEFDINDLKTGIFHLEEKRELSNEEAKELEAFFNSVIENPEIVDEDELVDMIDTYGFVFDCSYRGGEKYATALITGWDEPEQHICNYNEHCDMWECKAVASQIWENLREAMELKDLY